jgi:hypothetical protein
MLDESIVTTKMVYGKDKQLETFGNEKWKIIKGCVLDGTNKSPCQTESVRLSSLMLAPTRRPSRKEAITS